METLNGKVALITGGSRGIGYGIAEMLIKQNLKVAITGRTKSVVEESVKKLKALGEDNALGIVSDVRDIQSQQRSVEQVLQVWGKLDVLVANAGVGYFGSIEELTHEQWQETVDTNLTGVFNSIKASMEALKKSCGYIITMASLAGTNFFAGASAYNASKFGLVGFSQAVMLDLRKHGIKVTTIMPGSVATSFNGKDPLPEDAWKIFPDDIGQIIVDLLKMHPRTLPSKIEVRPSKPAAT